MKIENVDMFRFMGWSIIIFNGGQAVSGVIRGSYLYAGLMMAIGIAWLGLLEIRK